MKNTTEIMAIMGAIEIDHRHAPFLHRRINRLAVLAKIHIPKLFIIRDDAPNACAVSVSGTDTGIAVTAGLLTKLDENEIDAVLAHEIGHIQAGHSESKTKIAAKALFLAGAAAAGGSLITHSDLDFTPGDDSDDDLASSLIKLGIGTLVSTAGSAAAARTLTVESFRSEFEADSLGGLLSRKRWALARALQKLENWSKTSTQGRFRSEVAQLFIVAPCFLEHETHPPSSERIARLIRESSETEQPIADIKTCYCHQCGEKTDLDGNFCIWCGTKIA
jgi:heat shock protein HtpX